MNIKLPVLLYDFLNSNNILEIYLTEISIMIDRITNKETTNDNIHWSYDIYTGILIEGNLEVHQYIYTLLDWEYSKNGAKFWIDVNNSYQTFLKSKRK